MKKKILVFFYCLTFWSATCLADASTSTESSITFEIDDEIVLDGELTCDHPVRNASKIQNSAEIMGMYVALSLLYASETFLSSWRGVRKYFQAIMEKI